ncbi:hypothetical protein GCM10009789_02460 [Kribbella sancticallisti]|uniref:Uncharacterized protein n=1 Tax=Kribbella sancticallisti TaxID=460087 RepID=A0ABP4MYI8_9ACTN
MVDRGAGEPRVRNIGEFGRGGSVGVHRAFSGSIHQDDDRAGPALSLNPGIDARRDQFTYQCLAGWVVPDPADEPDRSTKAACENGDIGRGATSYALDPRRVVRPGPRRTVRPDHDVFNQITDAHQEPLS